MMDVQRELTAAATTKTGTTATRKKGGKRTGEQAAPADGVERLRQAADRRLGRHCARLADLLTDKALSGDLASTKMLLTLADGKKPVPVVKKPVQSVAMWLAAQPMRERPGDRPKQVGQNGAGLSPADLIGAKDTPSQTQGTGPG